MADRRVEIDVVANNRASSELDQIGGSADRADSRSKRLLGSLGAFAGGAIIGGVVAAGTALVGAFSGAEDAERGVRVLTSQIANLGPAGQAAFAGATDFADTFGASIARDNDDIIAVQTKLASFPDAFRAGSLGAEGMERATRAAFDLEAIGIGAAESNIVGIGKALNDPIKGMNALSRAGVSFSEAQKTAIKQAVEQGDLAKAQSVLLQGIESNAKGAAEAGVSNMQRLKTVAADFAEGLAAKALPYVEKFAGAAAEALPKVGDALDRIGAAVGKVIDWFQRAGTDGQSLADRIGNGLKRAADIVLPALDSIGKTITEDVLPPIRDFITAAQPVIDWLTGTFGPVVSAAFGAVVGVIKGALSIIGGIFKAFAGILSGDWSKVWDGIEQIGSGAMTALGGIIRLGVAQVGALFRTGISLLTSIATSIVNGVIGVVTGLPGRLSSLATSAVNLLGAAFRGGVAIARSAFTSIVNGVISVVTGLPGRLSSIGASIVDGLASGIRNAAGRVLSAAQAVVNAIPAAIRKIMGISSPAKVTRALGQNIMGSLGLGMADERAGVEDQWSRLDLRSPAPLASVTRLAGRAGTTTTGAGPGTVINVNVTGWVGSEDQLARAITDALDRAGVRGLGIGSGGVRMSVGAA